MQNSVYQKKKKEKERGGNSLHYIFSSNTEIKIGIMNLLSLRGEEKNVCLRLRASQCFLMAFGVKCRKFGIYKTIKYDMLIIMLSVN